MKKINIIKKNEDFKKILDQGKFIKNKYYIIYYKDKEESYYRFGITVSKKVSNRAVVRNKLKRQVKSIIDNNKNNFSILKDYIIIVKKSCLEVKYKELEKELINSLIKIKGD